MKPCAFNLKGSVRSSPLSLPLHKFLHCVAGHRKAGIAMKTRQEELTLRCRPRRGADVKRLLSRPGTVLSELAGNVVVVEDPVTSDVSSTKLREQVMACQGSNFQRPLQAHLDTGSTGHCTYRVCPTTSRRHTRLRTIPGTS